MRHEIAQIIQPLEHAPPPKSPSEKRRDPRWPFQVTQMVAFHDEAERPTNSMLRPVRCHDISLGGLSFFFAGPPPRRYCTVVLGRAPGLILVKARIVHSKRTERHPEEWLIGCEFVSKLDGFPLREV